MPKRTKSKQTNPKEDISPLKQLREEADITQQELATRMGVALSTVQRWDQGVTEPALTIAEWRKFCRIIKKNFDDLPDKLSSRDD